MTKATDFKFYARFGHNKYYLEMTNCPLSGRGQGHVTPSRISHLRNMSGTAESGVVKLCVLAGYVKC